MQLKSLSLLAGAIALTLTATPLAVQAQTFSNSRFQVAQAAKKGPWAALELTADQKARIQEIQRNTRTQMEAVFTPEQKAKLEAARQERQARRAQRQPGDRPQAGKRPGMKLADLNLTDDQKARMRAIREESQKQMQAVLTPEQQAKLQELKANRRQRWQQRNNNR
ncbi:P pilus assembly/Cpx signaling pathway, periplasmic inhibitor/zinc-resistance associated protein [Nostoc sp. PCC 7524]|uniref:Spy/CpxP family protein refolding chaperone n=1 Tax=Nostoc sp. (strain ATCC 29411 / PCC 7524) TaxID=28072 RepID=UPI00029F10DC|nr:pilus assembly protein [Nostoc sp. PCC 7524]AFY49744.1 P pilus assembly/Cpx signaling pathway, periplasmic inhibitor/zinc-resistance associated protein [Nostoc sp. PCC 7524]